MTAATPDGWYQDPSEPGQLRRWDGVRWTDEARPAGDAAATVLGGRPVTGRPALEAGFWTLGTALQIVIGFVVAVAALIVLVSVASAVVVRRWQLDSSTIDLGQARVMDTVSVALGVPAMLLQLVLIVVFLVWLSKAYGSASVDPSALRHSSGWAVGSWFVPILSLWRPYQIVRDLVTGARRVQAGQAPAATRRAVTLLPWWWGAFLVMGFVRQIATASTPPSGITGPTLEALYRSYVADSVSATVELGAAVLFLLVVRGIIATLRPR